MRGVLTITLVAMTLHAAPTKFTRVTGGAEAFQLLTQDYRDDVPKWNARRLAEGTRDVLVGLAADNCAFDLVEPDLGLFPHATRALAYEDTRQAKFIKDLLGSDPAARKRAYVSLVTDDKLTRSIPGPTFSAVALLIECDLRSPFVRMFLSLQPRWPAVFANRLRDLAANGTAVDRRYVVDLIRQTGKVADRAVGRAFYLGWQREADLDRVITSNGRVLFGEAD